MALLVDKYRPRSLETLTYHEDLSERLRSLVSPQVSRLELYWMRSSGAKRRLPSPSRLWPLRRREENPYRCNSQGTVRAGRWENQDRFSSFPDHVEPQARIQHCCFCLPSRDHAFGRRSLRSSSSTRPSKGGCADTTSGSIGTATVQGCGHQRGRSSYQRRTGGTEEDHGEIQPQSEIDTAGQ